MAQRFFKKFTIATTGTAQPLIGTTLTAAVKTGADPNSTTLPVADSSMFQVGDWAVVDAGAAAVERLRVQSVPDSTHIVVFQMANPHPSGAYVSLGKGASILYIQTIQNNTAALYLGNSSENTSTLAGVMAVLYQVTSGQPVDFRVETPVQNLVDTSDYWIAGTADDGYIPSFVTT